MGTGRNLSPAKRAQAVALKDAGFSHRRITAICIAVKQQFQMQLGVFVKRDPIKIELDAGDTSRVQGGKTESLSGQLDKTVVRLCPDCVLNGYSIMESRCPTKQ